MGGICYTQRRQPQSAAAGNSWQQCRIPSRCIHSTECSAGGSPFHYTSPLEVRWGAAVVVVQHATSPKPRTRPPFKHPLGPVLS